MDTTTRALIVDDEIVLRQVLSEILSEDFKVVEAASDGNSALKMLESFDPDIILTDINMPGMSGIDFIRKVRSTGNNVPVIFITARGEKDVMLNAIRLGAGDFLEKPFEIDDVKLSVHRVLQIANAGVNIAELIAKFGEDSPEVARNKRIVGLLQAVSSTKK